MKECLFAGAEYELNSALNALQNLIGKFHDWAPFEGGTLLRSYPETNQVRLLRKIDSLYSTRMSNRYTFEGNETRVQHRSRSRTATDKCRSDGLQTSIQACSL